MTLHLRDTSTLGWSSSARKPEGRANAEIAWRAKIRAHSLGACKKVSRDEEDNATKRCCPSEALAQALLPRLKPSSRRGKRRRPCCGGVNGVCTPAERPGTPQYLARASDAEGGRRERGRRQFCDRRRKRTGTTVRRARIRTEVP